MKKGIIFFALGIIAGLVANIGVNKVRLVRIFHDGWQNDEDLQHWSSGKSDDAGHKQ